MITADSRSALHAEIAAALPGDWQAQEQSLTRADGLQLDVKRQGRRYVIKPPALYLTLNSGRHTWYGNAPQITVAADAGPGEHRPRHRPPPAPRRRDLARRGPGLGATEHVTTMTSLGHPRRVRPRRRTSAATVKPPPSMVTT
ncbi:MAG: hypothetical protein R2851_27910 [Caldilineaceae bacterium]